MCLSHIAPGAHADSPTVPSLALPPALGNYADTSVQLGANTTVTPDSEPFDTVSINVSASTSFKGKLEADPVTSIVRVTNAHPAGTFTVTVRGFDINGASDTKTFLLTVTTPATCNPLTFATASLGVGTNPLSTAVGDFNRDGRQDIAVANNGSNSVSVLLGDGAGSFAAATSFNVGSQPRSVAVADLNNDGKQDIVTANFNSGDVSLLLGDGAGGFGAATSLTVGTNPFSVATGDFNNDGRPDLVAANSGADTVSILLADAAGGFAPASDNGVGDQPQSVVVGNFNGGAPQDIVTANNSSNDISVLLGEGAGAFGAATTSPAGTNPESAAVGDFNNDGVQDLVTADSAINGVIIFLGNGAGGFGSGNAFPVQALPHFVAVGDFNGDGNQDVVSANAGSNSVSVLLGDGAGSLGAATSFAVGNQPESVTVGDFNGDGLQDLVAANFGSGTVSVLVRQCPAAANTLVVNNVNDSGAGSLRQAILDSNATAGTQTITFNIPGAGVRTISPTSALPVFTDRVVVDGLTQPGFAGLPLVEVNGAGAGAVVAGLNVIAGSSIVRGLVINNFNGHGIRLGTAGGNAVSGNFIGTNAAGDTAQPNSGHGVFIDNTPNSIIGGLAAGDGNVISGNGGTGVRIDGSGATANTVAQNFIGKDATGTAPLGNTGDGVRVENASGNAIGGIGVGGNSIGFNGGDGVSIGAGTGNAVRGNEIHDNGTTAQHLGIDLGPDGANPNDAGDADTGANNLQNFPVITSAILNGNSLQVVGTLSSTASTTFRIEFFSSGVCDPSGFGEGVGFIGSTNVTTDGNGQASFNVNFAGLDTAVGDAITATATSTAGDTSEFSGCVAALGTATWNGSAGTDWHNGANWNNDTSPNAQRIAVIPSSGVTNEPSISTADAVAAAVIIRSGRTLTMQANRTLTASTVTIEAGGTLSVAAGQSARVNANLNVSGTLAGGAGSVFDFGGTMLLNNTTVSVPTLRFAGASQSIGGAGVVTSGDTFVLTGSTLTLSTSHVFDALTINNGATLDQSANSTLTVGKLTVGAGGLLRNLGDGDLVLKGDVSNAGTIQLNGAGAACGDADTILIRSSVAGTQRAWSGAGAFQLTDVDVQDQAGTAAIQVRSGTNSGNVGANWTFATCAGSPLTFTISGHIVDASNQALLGVNVHLDGSSTADTTTDAAGNYAFAGLAQQGNFTVTPTETNYRFTPPSRSVSNLQSDQTGVDFAGALVNHSITGTIVDGNGNGLPGVTVALAGARSATTQTNASGDFAFTNVPEGGSFTVTPDREGFTFNPPRQSINGISANVLFNAVGTAQPTPTPTPDPSDDFSGGPSPDPDKWSIGILTNPPPAFDPLVQVFLGGGLLHIQPRADANGLSYSGLVTARPLDLDSTPVVSVEVVQASQGEGAETLFGLGRDGDNWLRFAVQDASNTSTSSVGASTSSRRASAQGAAGQTLLFQLGVAGQKFSTGIPYNPSLHRFWRFRFDAPARLVIFETSPDSVAWTEQLRAALPADQTALIAELSAGTFKPTAAPTESLFDNFLLSPTPRVQFSATAFSAVESDAVAQVQVIRTGSDESTAAVDFATSNGTAQAGSDYTHVSGTLLFGIGERVKIVDIPILNDTVREGDETINLNLSNSVGARLGSITQAVLTILDDESPNQIDETAFFVRQHYLDFLGREPDAEGLQFWINNIESCGLNAACREAKRVDTSAAFFLSIEFQETGFVVQRFYKASFNRPPTFDEYLPDLTVIREGVIVGQSGALEQLEINKRLFAELWVNRAAFRAVFGSLNEMQYVDTLLANTGVTLVEEERTALIVGLLTNRETRAGVLLKLIEKEDFKRREMNPAFVRMEYFGYLRRDPDPEGFNFWLAKLEQFGGDFRAAEMVKAFLSSTEYRARFGQP
ncbi:MAG TPA: FG-GAP-like repeat-containing protein [Pyrinomonadaceae bacterium]